MALTKEDKKDVSSKLGKALANKVERATIDKPKNKYPGYRTMTSAQRRNARMDKIFADSKVLNEKYHGKDSFGSSKSSALAKKSGKSKIPQISAGEFNYFRENRKNNPNFKNAEKRAKMDRAFDKHILEA